jgi:hypothetical protein
MKDERKNLKIAPAVHTELKVFVAQNPGESMEDFSGFAIMKELRERGHAFVMGKKSPKKRKT